MRYVGSPQGCAIGVRGGINKSSGGMDVLQLQVLILVSGVPRKGRSSINGVFAEACRPGDMKE